MYQESEVLELKTVLTNDIKKELVAFANSKGGTILIGIDDNGQPVGVDNPEQICEQVSSIIHDTIKPDLSLFVDLSVIKIENKPIVQIDVQRGTRRPYYLAEKGLKETGVYTRLGNTSIPASTTTIRNMIVETDGTSYENMLSLNQNLTFRTVEQEFANREIELGLAQMKTLGIVNSDGLYTNLGLLLSDQCQHSIKVAVFQGTETTEFLNRKEFNGSLFKQLEDAYTFIDLNNALHSTFSGLNRIDSRDYSEAAIREVLLNAVIHREYAFSGSILASIYSNRLEVVSLGGLVNGLEPEDLFEGISQSRNAKLANIFYRLNYIEAYGTGIKKIISECAKLGVEPTFKVTNATFKVSIPNQRTLSHLKGMDQTLSDVYNFIKDNMPTSRKDIQNALGLKQTRSNLLLKDLETRKLIKKNGSGKATTYSVEH